MKYPELVALSKDIIPLWTSDEELDYLADIASQSKIVIEIGSWYGRSAKVLAAACPGVVYCVDNWEDGNSGEIFQKNMAQEIASGKVKVFRASSDIAAPLVAADMQGQLADVVWVDDGHLYTDVQRDITSYLPLLRSGGLMVGHDYYKNDPVAKAVEDHLPGFDIAVASIWRWKKP